MFSRPWWLGEAMSLLVTGALRALGFALPGLLFCLFLLLMKGSGSWHAVTP